MLKNYLRTAFRNLWRHRGFSLLNIIGLTIGMVAFFLIFLYVRFELSYESMFSKSDRIYRVVADIKTPTETINASVPAWAVPMHMRTEFQEVESAARVVTNDDWLVTKGDQHFEEKEVADADSTFFTFFDFPLLKGNPQTALRDPYSVVLTETTAKKYFGDANPMGQSLTIGPDKSHATVTGVMKDIPDNTMLKASMIISMSTITGQGGNNLDNQWSNYGPYAFVLLKPGVSAKGLE